MYLKCPSNYWHMEYNQPRPCFWSLLSIQWQKKYGKCEQWLIWSFQKTKTVLTKYFGHTRCVTRTKVNPKKPRNPKNIVWKSRFSSWKSTKLTDSNYNCHKTYDDTWGLKHEWRSLDTRKHQYDCDTSLWSKWTLCVWLETRYRPEFPSSDRAVNCKVDDQ